LTFPYSLKDVVDFYGYKQEKNPFLKLYDFHKHKWEDNKTEEILEIFKNTVSALLTKSSFLAGILKERSSIFSLREDCVSSIRMISFSLMDSMFMSSYLER
jgi:hypothetical protein